MNIYSFSSFRKIFIVILFYISTIGCFAQDVTVKAFTDTSDYQIGDRIKYTIQVVSDKSVNILATGFRDSIANVDVWAIDEPKAEEKDNTKITTFNFTISRFDSAQVTIPAIPVYYRVGAATNTHLVPFMANGDVIKDPSIQTILSNPVTFMVHSLKVNVQEDIKDVKDPVTIPMDWKIIALWILGGLIILGVAFYFYMKYRKKKAAQLSRPRIRKVPPHIAAINALNDLESKKLWQDGKVKEYHSEITEIIRKYFEERFHLPALELTTSEVMMHLRNIPQGAENIIDLTYNFLSNADLVKFAKYMPMNSVNEEMMKQANDIVNATVPSLRPAEVTEGPNV